MPLLSASSVRREWRNRCRIVHHPYALAAAPFAPEKSANIDGLTSSNGIVNVEQHANAATIPIGKKPAVPSSNKIRCVCDAVNRRSLLIISSRTVGTVNYFGFRRIGKAFVGAVIRPGSSHAKVHNYYANPDIQPSGPAL